MPSCGRYGNPIPPRGMGKWASFMSGAGKVHSGMLSNADVRESCSSCRSALIECAGTALRKAMRTA
eukprot:3777991-Amphidinium_carterae.2